MIGVVSGAVVLALTPCIGMVATRLAIVDRPGALKPQQVAVPYLGGVAVFAGIVVGVVAGRPIVVVPLALALGLGVVDDRSGLPAVIRLIGQVAVGIAVAMTVPVHLPGPVAVVSLVVAAVVVINGVNLIDGLDMLAAGVVAVAGIGFAVMLQGPGRAMAVALSASLAGFLVYNRPPARIYLGDGGSYLLGAGLTVLVADAWAPTTPLPVGVASLAVVAVPVAEVAFAIIRRARSGRSLLAGDRGHPYDRLVARGWPVTAASGAYVAAEALLVTGALIATHLASTRAAVIVDVVAAVLLVGLAAATGSLTPDEEART